MTFTPLPGLLAIARLGAGDAVPSWATGAFVSITRTAGELSIVCDKSDVPPGVRADRGWRALELRGPLPLTAVGVAAKFTAALAAAGISVLVIGTFDTDILLVKAERFDEALAVLQ